MDMSTNTRTVAIAFMEYPHTQLPFADSDIEALHEQGFNVITIALRGHHFIGGGISSPWYIARNFFSAEAMDIMMSIGWSGVRQIFFNGDQPLDAFKVAVLLPRALVAACYLRRKKVNHLHLFWGHYPSVLGIAWKLLDDGHRLTISLGAYDLEKKLRLSETCASIADKVTTHSDFNRRRLISEWGLNSEKVVTIYRGVNLQLFTSSADGGLRSNQFRVISVGRLIREKNLDLTLHLFAALRATKSSACLEVAGIGPDLRRLERIAETKGLTGHIKFMGHLSHDKLGELMRSARLMIFTSVKRGEILPNAIKEAMACGVVPVVLRHPAIDELIDDGIDGFLMSQGESLEAVVEKIVSSDLSVMSIRARQKINSKFDRVEAAAKFASICSEIDRQSESAQNN